MRGPARRSPGLGTLVLVSLLACGCAWIRIVPVTPEDRARRELVQARFWESQGSTSEAMAAYLRVLAESPENSEAWEARLRLDPADVRLLPELVAWQRRDPEDPLPHFLEGRLSSGGGARTAFTRAWMLAPLATSPLLDARRLGPRSWIDVSLHAELLLELEPRTTALDRACAWVLIGLRRAPEAASRLRDPGAQAMARVGLALQEGASDEARTAAVATLPEDEFPTALLRIAAAHAGSEWGVAATLLRESRRRWGDRPEFDVLEARSAAATGSRERAVALLEGALVRLTSPALRCDGTLLLHRLLPPAAAAASEWLRSAVEWAPSITDLDGLVAAMLDRGDLTGARAALLGKSAREPTAALVELWRAQAEWLTQWAHEERDFVRRWWQFFLRSQPAGERQARLAQADSRERDTVLGLMLTCPDPAVRVQALGVLREDSLFALDRVPPGVRQDADARVRAAWVVLAASRRGALARAAVIAARDDPDAYVREVARQLPLPEDD